MKEDSSIVAIDKFIQATRDSGYKNTASAISELVDNSIQAGATRIEIAISASAEHDKSKCVEISVLDNGCGMDPFTLRLALRFGGSTRFGDRTGLGRYGMGLPNASLSQARRLTVYTWRSINQSGIPPRGSGPSLPKRVLMSYLDVDEIINGLVHEVPRPKSVIPPKECLGSHGTLVIWTRCDRIDNVRVSTIARKIDSELGRRFRHFLWNRLTVTINGQPVVPFDPLYLHSSSKVSGARLFGTELEYEVCADPTDPATSGRVRVRFSELPVYEWHKFSNEQKRRIGITKGAGVSIVRAGHEVDYGWFFMGSKHRENYDDWWRCEIQFDPILDEAFGITHTKQQIRPRVHLIEALVQDLEATARALNSRVRKAHLSLKAGERFSEAEHLANERDHLLRPLPGKADSDAKALMKHLERTHNLLDSPSRNNMSRYRIIEGVSKDTCFYSYAYDGRRVVLVLNIDHPFYREIYKPLADGNSPITSALRAKIELVLLAAVRSELTVKGKKQTFARQRLEWSNTVATFLNDR